MDVCVIGITYQKASIEKREAAAFSDTQKLQLYDRLLDVGITQALVLTTCNRSECYFLYETNSQKEAAQRAFCELSISLKLDDLFVNDGKAALQYIFEVCGGYHSMIPGEDQIFGQMKQAYEFSTQVGACGKELHKIMQTCFACIKEVKHTYKISEISTSIAYLAYQYLKAHGGVHRKRILMIGSGEMAQLMLQYLKQEENTIWICSRNLQHAQQLLDNSFLKGDIIPYEERYMCAQQCDIIVSATSSPHLVLRKEAYPDTNGQQVLLDLASPRDIDEKIQDERHTLVNLDDLQSLVDEHAQQRYERMETAHGLLLQKVEEGYAYLSNAVVDEVITSLQKRSQMQAKNTFALLQKKLQLSPHEERILEKVLQASFLRLVKEPILRLKQLEEQDQKAYARMLATFMQKEEVHGISHRNKG